MPDIFISYSREDRPTAKLVAERLAAEGFDVWWDGALRAGDSYDEVTEDNLRGAGAVVVLWSKTSSKSKWVRAEATIGERHSVLVPAVIEDCDRPLRFELIQTADLTQWKGDPADSHWQGLVADINAALARKEKRSPAPAPDTPPTEETIESVFWSAIKDTSERAELEAYLKRYKDGRFAHLARQRLAAMTRSGAASEESAPAGVPQALIAIAIFALATMTGMAMIVIANALHIGSFTWAPSAGADQLLAGVKEIGFIPALNWSVAALVLMPAAWTMIYLALAESRDVWSEMARRRMLVAKDFTPVTAAHAGFQSLQKHIRLFVGAGMIAVTALTIVLSMSDHAQVSGRFYGGAGKPAKLDRIDSGGYALGAPDIDRDWMVAALLSTPKRDKPEAGPNHAFSLAAYFLYVGLGIGSLLSFGLLAIGLGATFMRGIARHYGLQVIPDLRSNDRRCGFDVVQRFFVYAFAVAFIGCVLCYLMGVQNLYLRSPYESIFAFLAPDAEAFESAANWRGKIDALAGFLFAESAAKGTRNVYAWIFGFFIFAVFIGGFMFLLRQGATLGRAAIMDEIRAGDFARLEKLTDKDAAGATAGLAGMQVWPLDRPTLRESLAIVALLVASFVFYKLGALVVLALCLAVPFALWRSRD